MRRAVMKKIRVRILLIFIIILPFIMAYHIYHNKKQLEDLKSGKIQIEEGYIPSSDIHPESAYLWIMPYTIVEVGVLVFYLVYRQD